MKKILPLLIVCILSIGGFSVTFWEDSCEYIEWKKYYNMYDIKYSLITNKFSYLASVDWINDIIIKDWVKVSTKYDNDSVYGPKFSPDWKSFVYSVIDTTSWLYFLVKNWKEIKKDWLNIVWFVFWKTWDQFTYIFNTNYWQGIVKEWTEIGLEYNSVGSPLYSPDWKSFSYIAQKDNWNWIIVKDWKQISSEYLGIKNLLYSPDWKSFSYIAVKEVWKMIVVKDWKEILGEYWNVKKLLYSPDSNSLSYIAEKDSWKQIVIKDWEQIWNEFDWISELTYSNNSDEVSFIWNNWNRFNYKNNIETKVIIKNWKQIPEKYDVIYSIWYHKKWDIFYYYAGKWNKVFLVDNWIEILNEYDYKEQLKYSPNTNDIFYDAWKYLDKNITYILKNWKIYDTIPYSSISNIHYWENGKDLIFTTSQDNWFKNFTVKRICTLDKNNNIKKTNTTQISKTTQLKINKTVPQFFKQLIISKNNLKKTFQGRKNIKTIDLISKKLSKQKLEILIGKLQKIDTSLVQFRKYKDMLDYLEAKVWLVLLK